MITFIKDYNLDAIKKKLILLYILNLIDIIMTLLLLSTGLFREVNFVMAKLVESPLASILCKAILPAILLSHLYIKIKDSAMAQCENPAKVYQELRISNIGINISILIYAVVNLSHLIWTALLPYFYSIT
ncbi:MAG: hypothetical protein GX359_09460 [Clostridiales bacterium]|nr:hypothetical protein [Clostridiales bacterium]